MKSSGLFAIIATSAIATVVVAAGVSWAVAATVSHSVALAQASVVAGAAGKDGAPGRNGKDGTNGAIGADGLAGATGARGITASGGAVGATGKSGTNGAIGQTGSAGLDAAVQTVIRSVATPGGPVTLNWAGNATTIAALTLPKGTYAIHVDGSITGTFTHNDGGYISCTASIDNVRFDNSVSENSPTQFFPGTNLATTDGTQAMAIVCQSNSIFRGVGSDVLTWTDASISAIPLQ